MLMWTFVTKAANPAIAIVCNIQYGENMHYDMLSMVFGMKSCAPHGFQAFLGLLRIVKNYAKMI